MEFFELIDLWVASWRRVSDKIKAARAEGRVGLSDTEVDELFSENDRALIEAKAAVARAKAEGR